MNRNRMPQAVILNGSDENTRTNAANFLSLWAVCSEEPSKRPCTYCKNCSKAINDSHPDIFRVLPENKTKTISIKQIRDYLIPQFSIIPNESDVKVFIIPEADKTLKTDTQDALLKSIEEPPQNILFIFTTENVNILLPTIRSRSQIFNLSSGSKTDETADRIARDILSGIISHHESDLLFACSDLKTKEIIKEVIPVVSVYLSKALSVSVGNRSDDEIINKIGKKVSKLKIIGLIDACDEILLKAETNINQNILNTYICMTLRRIQWRK